jgi:hypothetical protein
MLCVIRAHPDVERRGYRNAPAEKRSEGDPEEGIDWTKDDVARSAIRSERTLAMTSEIRVRTGLKVKLKPGIVDQAKKDLDNMAQGISAGWKEW